MATSHVTGPSSSRRWAGLGILTLAVLLLAIDGTVLALAIPALTADLEPSSTQILWIGDIYAFALAGLLVVMGNLADRLGRKRLLMIGSIGFGLSSLAAAFAPTPELLIVARTVLGISGATIMPSTLAIVRDLFPDARERTRAVAVWAAGATAGAAIGPVVGGMLLQHFHWGSVFLINVPIMLIVVIGGTALLPESRDPGKGRIDVLSAVLSFVAIVPIVYAVKHLVAEGFDVTVVGGIVVGVAAGWWFIVRQRRVTTPLIDVALFRRPAFSGAVVADTVTIFGFVGLLFFFSQYLQLVRGLSPLGAGLVELSASVASVIVIALAGAAVAWLGRGRAIGAGLALAAIGLVVLAVAEGAAHLVWIVVAFAVIGFGTGLSMALNTDAIVSAAPPNRAGAASSVAETAYELGAALGIAVLGSLQNVFYRAHLPAIGDAGTRAVIEDSLAAASSHLDPSAPGMAELLERAREAFIVGMQWTSIIAAILVAAAAAVAWFVIPSHRERPRVETTERSTS